MSVLAGELSDPRAQIEHAVASGALLSPRLVAELATPRGEVSLGRGLILAVVTSKGPPESAGQEPFRTRISREEERVLADLR